MSFMAAMGAMQGLGAIKGSGSDSGGGSGMAMPSFGGGTGSPLSSSSSADMGDDFSKKVFGSLTVGGAKSGTEEMIKWGVFVLGGVLVAKILKG